MSRTYFFEIKDIVAHLGTQKEIDEFRAAIKKSKKLTVDERKQLGYCCDARETCLWWDSYEPTPEKPQVVVPVRGERLKMRWQK